MDTGKLINTAFILAIITITYNLAEGLVSIYFGLEDDTLALLGFGADSFVEFISGVGILHMIFRMRRSSVEKRDKFEKQALRITGFAFYLLTIGLIVGSILNVVGNTEPETTMVGIIVSSISIFTMYFLMRAKLKVGKALHSDAIIADANCTKTCFYLSIVLLTSSLLYEFTGIGYIDIAGSLGIAWFAFTEGKEAFEKAKNGHLSCCSESDCEK
jgi:divalent metal cation (Fe/Co/Zn/Cd) transporter